MTHKHFLPPQKLGAPVQLGQKARIKAFRVPTQYALEAIIGYQGDSKKFKTFGYAGNEIPDGWKIWQSGVWSEYTRGDGIYCVIEHHSFPEIELGKGPIPVFEFVIGEREVEWASNEPSIPNPFTIISPGGIPWETWFNCENCRPPNSYLGYLHFSPTPDINSKSYWIADGAIRDESFFTYKYWRYPENAK